MRTADLARQFASDPLFVEALGGPPDGRCLGSTAYEARPFLVAGYWHRQPRKMLVVTASYERALAWQAKLSLCGIPAERLRQLPSGMGALFEDSAPEHIAQSDRLGALRALVSSEPNIILAAPQAALERTLPRDVLLDAHIDLAVGEEFAPEVLTRRLLNLGYEPQEPVQLPGQFSRRGGIFDIFAIGHETPFRIEFFGDEIESIRAFDSRTQRSITSVKSISLVPSRETVYTGDSHETATFLLDTLEREAAQLDEEPAERLRSLVSGDAQALSERVYFDRLDLYRPILHPDAGCSMDLLGCDGLLVLDEPLELDAIASRAEEDLAQALDARTNRGEILHSTAHDFLLPADQFGAYRNRVTMSSMNGLPDWHAPGIEEAVQAITLDAYRGRPDALALTLRNYLREAFSLYFTTDQPNRAKTVLSYAEIFATTDHKPEDPSSAVLVNGNLGGGFVLPKLRIAVVSDAELFGVARLKLPQRRQMEGAPVATVLDLKPGDYVVHIQFGIGIFRGLVKREIEGVEKEFLFIEYQAPDKLFVPADQLDRVQKYLNPGDEQPKLNRLTGGEWQRTLGKAREEAKAFARDLVKLYAQRKRVQRPSYGPDTPFQDEMECTFPWVETPSQLQAIKDAKTDMRLDYPMDRLVCGDVGFGKTEVAIRAAFKSVQAARQVAVLCPTTILSEQHFRSFSERLAPFGTKLGLVNRFTNPPVRKNILRDLKDGITEIVVGTHSLLGVGIQFKHLGLVIIDEEQKFGVKQKEMLKQLRTQVDVLTLSATPIPRTLSMALMDIRQMSLINDPPPGRLPIRTFVRPYASEVVREAILRELARGGQVFYVYNRVESINHVAEKLRRLVPHARIGIGHGQMSEKDLEPVMIGFIRGEIDVLLSTTIIESGIDIPNANTIIVEQSDRLGLAQLYQLRGRVGRSDRQAYAYLLHSSSLFVDQTVAQPNSVFERSKKNSMSDGAMARLQALQEFSTLGSGYSLAFRDLQIRGAGELLGAKQSGTMVTVGYELYTQLINEAVTQLKNVVDDSGAVPATAEETLAALEPLPSFEVPLVALLPDSYIKDAAQRLYYYQRMMTSKTESELADAQAEVEDRYGHPPEVVSNAFAVMGQRMRARSLGIEKLDAKGGRIAISFRDLSKVPPRALTLLGRRKRDCYTTRELLIWPYAGNPILAIEQLLVTFQECLDQVESERAAIPR